MLYFSSKKSKKEFEELIAEKPVNGEISHTTRQKLAKKFKSKDHIRLFCSFFKINPNQYKIKRIRW
jgi:hypothetical protein